MIQPLVLAAGRATRMGPAGKLAIVVDGRPLLAHVLAAVAEAGLPSPLVTTGAHADAVRAAAAGWPARFVHVPDHADGLSRSLHAGIAALPPEARGVLVLLGDMPRVRPETLRALAAAFRDDADVVAPWQAGRRGNPVLWGRAWFARLAALDGDRGGGALLAEIGAGARRAEVDDPGIHLDIDTPAALSPL